MDSKRIPKVAIIGGGIAGTLNAKHLSYNSDIAVTVFEYRDKPFGVWYYSEISDYYSDYDKNKDLFYQENATTSPSMYDLLELNTPYPFIQFKDFHIKNTEKVCLNRREFYDYLMKYFNHFKLQRLFKFNTFVLEIGLLDQLTKTEKQELKNNNLNKDSEETNYDRKFFVKSEIRLRIFATFFMVKT